MQNLSGINSVLKTNYSPAIQKQLNEEVAIYARYEKAKYKWSGDFCVVPLHVSRNTGIGFRAESGTLPTAGAQGYTKCQVYAKNYYGAFKVTGPAMDAAASGGAAAYINVLDSEMKGLVDDIKVDLNRLYFWGGPVKALIATHVDTVAFDANTVVGTANTFKYVTVPAAADWDFLEGLTTQPVVTTPTTFIRVKAISMDDYDEITASLGANPGLYIAAYSRANGTVTLAAGASDGAGQAGQFQFSNTGLFLGASGFGYAIALQIHETQAVDSAAAVIGQDPTAEPFVATAVGSVTYAMGRESFGVVSNLCLPNHHAVSRATGGTTVIRSTVVGNTITVNRAALTRSFLDSLVAHVENLSGQSPGDVWMNSLQLQKYKALLVDSGTIGYQVSGEKATGGDAGFMDSAMKYGNRPIYTSRHIPNGLIFLENKETWELFEMRAGSFADNDGSVLERVTTKDEWQGFWVARFNMFCYQPERNAIAINFTL